MRENLIASLDIGTTKVCCIIAGEGKNGNLSVLSYGVAESEAFASHNLININKLSQAVEEAVQKAKAKIEAEIENLKVNISGEHITGLRYKNYVTIVNDEREIGENDLKRLRLELKSLKIPVDKEIVHVLPEEYIIDGQGGITDPIGISGNKLEAASYVVMANKTNLNDITKAVEKAGYKVGSFVLSQIATSAAVLEENEKDLGVLLIDIGGLTTDIIVIHRKTIKLTKVYNIGGKRVTADIREALGIITEDAESLKRVYGYATQSALVKEEMIPIKGFGARRDSTITVSLLTDIINARLVELFKMIDADLRALGVKNKIKAGIIVTGGGAMIKGCTELIEEVFGMPAKIGFPSDKFTGHLNEIEKPEFATALGLLEKVQDMKINDENESARPAKGKTNKEKSKSDSNNDQPGKIKGIIDGFKKFFNDL